uniref:Uncharacterized protein n=1 Tax=Panagrellus redivivus TaxID=6233 RepID=A0A7E4USY7_PANRE
MSMPFQNVTFDSLFSRSRSSSRASTQSESNRTESNVDKDAVYVVHVPQVNQKLQQVPRANAKQNEGYRY